VEVSSQGIYGYQIVHLSTWRTIKELDVPNIPTGEIVVSSGSDGEAKFEGGDSVNLLTLQAHPPWWRKVNMSLQGQYFYGAQAWSRCFLLTYGRRYYQRVGLQLKEKLWGNIIFFVGNLLSKKTNFPPRAWFKKTRKLKFPWWGHRDCLIYERFQCAMLCVLHYSFLLQSNLLLAIN